MACQVEPRKGDLRAFAAGASAGAVFVTGDRRDSGGDSVYTVAIATT